MGTFTAGLLVLATLVAPGAARGGEADARAGEGRVRPGQDGAVGRAESREIKNSIGMKLVRIPPGEFVMGNLESLEDLARAFPGYEPGRFTDLNDDPPHKVRITRPFFMGAHEVTIGQFKRFIA